MGPVSRYSRYFFCTAQPDAGGSLFLSEPVPFRFVPRGDTREHVAGQGDTWWSLAARYFPGIPDAASLLWGYIADFQPAPPVDPTVTIVPGTVIYIPSRQTLEQEILNEARRPDFQG